MGEFWLCESGTSRSNKELKLEEAYSNATNTKTLRRGASFRTAFRRGFVNYAEAAGSVQAQTLDNGYCIFSSLVPPSFNGDSYFTD